MQKITIIIGLPGSGKTTYLLSNKELFGDALVCDDYHKHSSTMLSQKNKGLI